MVPDNIGPVLLTVNLAARPLGGSRGQLIDKFTVCPKPQHRGSRGRDKSMSQIALASFRYRIK